MSKSGTALIQLMRGTCFCFTFVLGTIRVWPSTWCSYSFTAARVLVKIQWLVVCVKWSWDLLLIRLL